MCVPECTVCPAGTEPVLGYEYKWWNVLPSNMKTSCFNVGNSKCDDMNGEHKHRPISCRISRTGIVVKQVPFKIMRVISRP